MRFLATAALVVDLSPSAVVDGGAEGGLLEAVAVAAAILDDECCDTDEAEEAVESVRARFCCSLLSCFTAGAGLGVKADLAAVCWLRCCSSVS